MSLTLARPTLDKPSMLNVFIGKNGITISILNEEDCDAET